ncbi:hypothetical protein C8R43DRAFT_1115336 [Mycena crocata]|nr:hypothetical protein C8R43DRAFT_1115336 [Mycena crocata]
MCLGGDETVDPTKPDWSRRRPTSAQRDLERQARNSPSEMLYPPGDDYGFPSCARVPGSLRSMGSSCSPEQLDGLAAVKGVCTETDRKKTPSKTQQPEVNEQGPPREDNSPGPPRNRRAVNQGTMSTSGKHPLLFFLSSLILFQTARRAITRSSARRRCFRALLKPRLSRNLNRLNRGWPVLDWARIDVAPGELKSQ